MESFYGGERGFSFEIVKTFSSKSAMVTEFKKGSSYTEVNYNEYVLIDSGNKNDTSRGDIYRRGYDYNNSDGGAIYISNIAGPDGNAPMLELDTYSNVESRHQQNPSDKYGSGNCTVANGNLLPGKTSTGTFNDSIQYNYCSERDENLTDTNVYMGFKIPYPVIEFTSLDSGESGDDQVTRQDDGSHPFYAKYKINTNTGTISITGPSNNENASRAATELSKNGGIWFVTES